MVPLHSCWVAEEMIAINILRELHVGQYIVLWQTVLGTQTKHQTMYLKLADNANVLNRSK